MPTSCTPARRLPRRARSRTPSCVVARRRRTSRAERRRPAASRAPSCDRRRELRTSVAAGRPIRALPDLAQRRLRAFAGVPPRALPSGRCTPARMRSRGLRASARARATRALRSFPLDRRRRLARNVVDDAVDAAHLVDDRVLTRASSSCGSCAQCAVMKSVVCTARSATACSYVRPSPITPTERTGRNTANACAVLSYHDWPSASRAARSSSMKIASARRSRSAYSRFTSPRMRTPRPGPGTDGGRPSRAAGRARGRARAPRP